MSYTLTGEIKLIQDAQTFSSGFTKREFVVTVQDGQYAQDINLECLQDKVSLLDGLTVGDTVTAHFNIRGREYNGRYFNNLACWKIEVESASIPAGDDRPQIPDEPTARPGGDDGFDEEIPF